MTLTVPANRAAWQNENPANERREGEGSDEHGALKNIPVTRVAQSDTHRCQFPKQKILGEY